MTIVPDLKRYSVNKIRANDLIQRTFSLAAFIFHSLHFIVTLSYKFLDTETPTPCEKQRNAALQGTPDAFAPFCRPDGSFDPIQCKGLMCYCVDSDGRAIKGTDTPRPTRPDCEGR